MGWLHTAIPVAVLLVVPMVLLLGAIAARAADAEVVAVDFADASAVQVARVATNDAFRFDGKRSCLQLPADLPKKIGQRDFSIAFEFRPEKVERVVPTRSAAAEREAGGRGRPQIWGATRLSHWPCH